jgi:UDP-glucose 4-epimerase
VELTTRLGEAATAAGVDHFILMSSIAAVSNAASEFVSDDFTYPADTVYGSSKRQAEDALAGLAPASGMRAVILRPPMVYGEGMRGNPLRLFHHLARGLPLPVVRPAVRRSMMYVGNLAEAVLRAVTYTDVAGRFCVTDHGAIPIDDFARAAAHALGRRARLVPVPGRMLWLIGTLGETAGRVVRVRFDRRTAARLTRSLLVDGSRFARVTNFAPPYSQREGVERTARWFVAAHEHRSRIGA